MITPQQGEIIAVEVGTDMQENHLFIVISNNIISHHTEFIIVAPILETQGEFPLHIELPSILETKGKVLLDQIATLDYKTINVYTKEQVPSGFLEEILDITRRIFTT